MASCHTEQVNSMSAPAFTERDYEILRRAEGSTNPEVVGHLRAIEFCSPRGASNGTAPQALTVDSCRGTPTPQEAATRRGRHATAGAAVAAVADGPQR